MSCGGLGAIHRMVRRIGLQELLDSRLDILKRARPYQDSDHVLNIAYNLLCGGHVLDDIELRRNDAAFLDLLGARAIPDPTTAGDFCRRFDSAAVWRLMDVLNDARVRVWKMSGRSLTQETARIDADDIVQESYLRLVRSPPATSDLQQLRAFLFRIASRLIVDH